MGVSTLRMSCARYLSLIALIHKQFAVNWFRVGSLALSVLLIVGGILFAKAVPFSSVEFMTMLIGGVGYFLVVSFVVLLTLVGSVVE